MSKPLTEAQCRILLYLLSTPGWHFLKDIEDTLLLERDDVVVIPSLIERNFINHLAKNYTVSLTREGAEFARLLREAKKRT